jgi:hypothetical protein
MHKTRITVWIALAAMLSIMAGPQALAGQAVDREGMAREMEKEIGRTLERGRIPSATVALVLGQEIIWTGAAGYANIWAKTWTLSRSREAIHRIRSHSAICSPTPRACPPISGRTRSGGPQYPRRSKIT